MATQIDFACYFQNVVNSRQIGPFALYFRILDHALWKPFFAECQEQANPSEAGLVKYSYYCYTFCTFSKIHGKNELPTSLDFQSPLASIIIHKYSLKNGLIRAFFQTKHVREIFFIPIKNTPISLLDKKLTIYTCEYKQQF